MHNEAYSLALNNALTEIKNICPDVNTSFLFDKEGKIIAGDNGTIEAPLEKAVDAIEGIFEKTETIGGLDTLVINGQMGKMHISCINDMYLAMVTSKNADMTYVQTVSRVLIPTVIKLLDNITSVPTKLKFPSSRPSPVNLPDISKQEEAEEAEEEDVDEATEQKDEEEVDEEKTKPQESGIPPKQELPEPPNQLIVDTLGGLFVRGDTVQIDTEILNQWSEYYDGAKIKELEIESFNGNSTRCKVKPIKDSKIEGRRIIRIPDEACQNLHVKKGELVQIKPLIQEE